MKLTPLLESPDPGVSHRSFMLHVQQLLLEAELKHGVEVDDVDLLRNGWLIKASKNKRKAKFKVLGANNTGHMMVTQHLAGGKYNKRIVTLSSGAEATAYSIIEAVKKMVTEHAMQGGFDA